MAGAVVGVINAHSPAKSGENKKKEVGATDIIITLVTAATIIILLICALRIVFGNPVV